MKQLWIFLFLLVRVPARAGEGDLPGTPAVEEESGLPALAAAEIEELLEGRGASSQPMFFPEPALGDLQARLHFLPFLAGEGAITVHEDRDENRDAGVAQYPVPMSAAIYPLPKAPFSPSEVGGGGWSNSRITSEGDLSGLPKQTEPPFGAHAGAEVEIRPGTSTSIDAGRRHLFLRRGSSAVRSEDYSDRQAGAELNRFF